MAVNVLGTWHVLLAAEAAAAGRVIHFSSAQVLGIAGGERPPDYLPVSDAHPRRAARAYGLSKVLAEDLCAGFTDRAGIPAVSLRPVMVWDPGMYQRAEALWRAGPEWTPFWELGAFVDVRDVAGAVQRALAAPLSGHHRALLCAADIAATRPAVDMAARLARACRRVTPPRSGATPGRLLGGGAAARLAAALHVGRARPLQADPRRQAAAPGQEKGVRGRSCSSPSR
jgi:nucleoside-diphosphate-sugar epimerase